MADAGTQQNSLVLGKNKQTGKSQPFPIDDENSAVRVLPVGGERWIKLGSGQLTGSAAALVTSGKAYKDAKLVLVNADTAAVYYATVYLLTGGASAADTELLAKGYGIVPGGRAVIEFALGNGDVLNGLADTTLKISWLVMVKDQV